VVQEILLAQEVRILCGATWIMLTDMETCGEKKQAIIRLYIKSESLFLLWDRRHNRSNQRLGQCVKRYTRNKCKDPRDKVYALRGILTARQSEMLLVYYKRSVLEVSLDAVGIIVHSPFGKSPNSLVGSNPFFRTEQVRSALCLRCQMLKFVEMAVVRPFSENIGERLL
jgi:hypothetical protein